MPLHRRRRRSDFMALHPRRACLLRLLTSVAVLGVVAVTAAGCMTTSWNDSTGLISAGATPRDESEWRRESAIWSERYRANPNDPNAAIRYAQALRATGQRAQAVAVLEQSSLVHPKNTQL